MIAESPAPLLVFDLDGTLLDSDAALAAAFSALGVPSEAVTYGHVVADECVRLGINLDDYLDAYDTAAAPPFPGVVDTLLQLPGWAVCSNKHPRSGWAELERLGWTPDVALFADAFAGPKRLTPVLDALQLSAQEIVFVGDTAHDRRCALDVGCPFVLAGWNPRAQAAAGDLVLAHPSELIGLVAPRR